MQHRFVPPQQPILLLLITTSVWLSHSGVRGDDSALDFFERRVRPLLIKRCSRCHGPQKQESGLRLDHIHYVRKGGAGGPVVDARKPLNSRLLIAVQYNDPDLKMPPDARLTDREIADLRRWVELGAPWPNEELKTETAGVDYDRQRLRHWAWQPIANSRPPQTAINGWARSPVDRFIADELEQQGLTPNTGASRRQWLRRVTFDLVGLPPSEAELAAFVGDNSPAALDKVVDRLLASPRYGERWARHWLDVARYADTTANDGNFVMRYAYRYRNYVIGALNSDMPYNQFLREQIAGDLMYPRGSPASLRGHIATGFLMLGPKGLAEADKEQLRMDMVDEQIDVLGRAMLGVSLACARCHDHKFDPVTTSDYYALAGIFRSLKMLNGANGPTSMWHESPVTSRSQTEQQRQQLSKLRQRATAARKRWLALLDNPAPGQPAWEAAWQKPADPPSPERPEAPAAEPLLNPQELDGLLAMYRADSLTLEDGEPVTFWRNELPGRRELSLVSTADNAPGFLKRGINGNPVVRFGEKEHFLTSVQRLGILGAEPYSLIVVLNPRQSQAQRTQAVMWGDASHPAGGTIFEIDRVGPQAPRLDLATGHSVDATTEMLQLDKPQIWSARYSGGPIAQTRVAVDGRRQTVSAAARAGSTVQATRDDILVVGGKGTDATHRSVSPEMDVAEILVFRRHLTDAEERQLGAHLSAKFGLATEYPDLARRIAGKLDRLRTRPERRFLRWLFLRQHSNAFAGWHAEWNQAANQLATLRANTIHSASGTMVMFPLEEAGRNLRIHLRGNRTTLGDIAPRRPPHLFADQRAKPITTPHSGRRELANWIVNSAGRLSARLVVNRIWQHHFGQGLVVTSDNFGVRGQSPSHPQLLDYLAVRFVDSGWSIKQMHRWIVLSSAYRQSTVAAPDWSRSADGSVVDPLEIDAGNRLLWKAPRRRLEAEVIRDAILAVSGQLDQRCLIDGRSAAELFEMGEAVDKQLGLVSVANVYDYAGFQRPVRSIYLPFIRNGQAEIFNVFDVADANAVTARRSESTVSTQAMFLLNSPWVRQQAAHFADRLLAIPQADTATRLRTAYQLAFGRPATVREIQNGRSYLAASSPPDSGRPAQDALRAAWQSYCQILFCMNEFIYVD